MTGYKFFFFAVKTVKCLFYAIETLHVEAVFFLHASIYSILSMVVFDLNFITIGYYVVINLYIYLLSLAQDQKYGILSEDPTRYLVVMINQASMLTFTLRNPFVSLSDTRLQVHLKNPNFYTCNYKLKLVLVQRRNSALVLLATCEFAYNWVP